jgi:Rod binding domain-containing protein
MAAALAFPAPVATASPTAAPSTVLGTLAAPGGKSATDPKAKAHAAAVDFEAVFLNSMFQQMFTGIDGEGPFGGGGAIGVWRSFLSDQYAKTFAKSGGIGIADHVYRSLLAQQEVAAN